MALPVVAIVGRPNVGKSSLFNALARRRTSIAEPTAGVTRDRVTTVCDIDGVYFELVDTSGHGIVDRDDLDEHVERQILCAVEQAHLILFLVDGREGLTPLDHDTAELLRQHHQVERVRLLANKVDEPHMESSIGEFARLGFGQPLAVSAMTGLGRTALRELIRDILRSVSDEVPAGCHWRLARQCEGAPFRCPTVYRGTWSGGRNSAMFFSPNEPKIPTGAIENAVSIN